MPLPETYTEDLPDDVLLDVAVLTRKVGAEADVPFGVSRGGISVEPMNESRQIEGDGLRSPIGGNDRYTKRNAKVSGTFIQFNKPQIDNLEHGATAVVTGTVETGQTTTITPKGTSALIAKGELIQDARVTWLRGNGGTCGYLFDLMFCNSYKVSGQDNNEVEVQCDFEGRLDLAKVGVTMKSATYKIFVTDPPAPVGP